MPLQKLSGVAIFVSLQECGFSRLQLTPATNSPWSRNKIRLAFHFVERNDPVKTRLSESEAEAEEQTNPKARNQTL